MSLEHLLRGIEAKLSEESMLLELAKVWMEKTEGLIAEGMRINTDDYITALRKIPLWEKVKDDIPTYLRMLRENIIRKSDKLGPEARLFIYFPRILYTLEDFLQQDIFSTGAANHGFIGNPLPLNAVLSGYSTRQKKVQSRTGDCKSVYALMKNGLLQEKLILELLGCTERWKEYQETKKLTSAVAVQVGNVVETFLRNPLYSQGRGPYGQLSSPLTLRVVLNSFIPERAVLKPTKGDCRQVYQAVQRGHFSEEEVLNSIGLRDQWTAYQATQKLPPSIAARIKEILESFLKSPLYSSGSGNHGSLASPLPLRAVLSTYVAAKGKLKKNSGDCLHVYRAIHNEVLTEEFVLESVGLAQQWNQYQQTRQLPQETTNLLRRTLEHFLHNPLYAIGTDRYKKSGSPLPLNVVLLRYKSDTGKLSRSNGDCRKMYRIINRNGVTPEFLLQSVNLAANWQAYSQTNAQKPYITKNIQKV